MWKSDWGWKRLLVSTDPSEVIQFRLGKNANIGRKDEHILSIPNVYWVMFLKKFSLNLNIDLWGYMGARYTLVTQSKLTIKKRELQVQELWGRNKLIKKASCLEYGEQGVD